jgi:hypothetical protein
MAHRGGYRPFYDAVAELSTRGTFDATEVSDDVTRKYHVAATTPSAVGKLDEFTIAYPDGVYNNCDYRREGATLTIGNAEYGGLFVERFVMRDVTIKFDDAGKCKLEIKYGGRYAAVCTGTDQRDKRAIGLHVSIQRGATNGLPNEGGTATGGLPNGRGDQRGNAGRTFRAAASKDGSEDTGTRKLVYTRCR